MLCCFLQSTYCPKMQPCMSISSAHSVHRWSACVMINMHCSCSQALGLLLRTTTNPKTRTVDYAEVGMDLVSLALVGTGALRCQPDGTQLQSPYHVLPLYITQQHWQRVLAGQSLERALQVLCPEHRAQAVRGPLAPPTAWLQALPKLLNTAVVLLMDKVSYFIQLSGSSGDSEKEGAIRAVRHRGRGEKGGVSMSSLLASGFCSMISATEHEINKPPCKMLTCMRACFAGRGSIGAGVGDLLQPASPLPRPGGSPPPPCPRNSHNQPLHARSGPARQKSHPQPGVVHPLAGLGTPARGIHLASPCGHHHR